MTGIILHFDFSNEVAEVEVEGDFHQTPQLYLHLCSSPFLPVLSFRTYLQDSAVVLPQGATALAPLLVIEHLNHDEIFEKGGKKPSSVVELKDGGHVTCKGRGGKFHFIRRRRSTFPDSIHHFHLAPFSESFQLLLSLRRTKERLGWNQRTSRTSQLTYFCPQDTRDERLTD